MFAEDLSVFFDTVGGFADEAIYDGAFKKPVIFDRAYLEQLGIAGTHPMALAPAADFPEAAVDKTLLIKGTLYTIRGREPQGDGALVILTLRV